MTTSFKDPHSQNSIRLAGDLRKAIGRLRRRMLREAGMGDLTTSQTAVLLRIEQDGPATISTIARAEGVKPQSMRATVGALEVAGYVERTADPGDGRQSIISLTETYRRWIESGRAVREDWLIRRIEAVLTREEQALLISAMPALDRLGEG